MAARLTSGRTQPRTSNRSFGLVFAFAFALLALWPALYGRPARWWCLGVSGAFLLVALVMPSMLGPLNRLWLKLGLLLHKVASPIALAIVFFGVITPMGGVMRLLRKDPLKLRSDPRARSYWVPREPPGPARETFKDQF